ncbi:acetyltransferase [Arachidicoccus ginsenosidimutans]|uniref:GNAT family N-acetyltransferase n=1 Tax=Arachidicoccus sp. BS20 TaxID=1850526 RepID=UPI0007F115C9|nr:GNAT family N-acetyltransferase [Arachidicoccus sp. BS20]ANI90658.1 acetyltransferase [Arachidicoccus sp. BS20]
MPDNLPNKFFEIREIRSEDNPTVAKTIREVFHEFDAPQCGTVYSDPTTDNLYELFRTPKSVFFVAEINDMIVGSCGIYPTENLPEGCAELVKFYISKEARGKGLGKILMEKCFEAATNFGYTQLYIESLPVFSKAVSIYEKNGFKRLENPLGNSGHPTCNIWMIKNLV